MIIDIEHLFIYLGVICMSLKKKTVCLGPLTIFSWIISGGRFVTESYEFLMYLE